jgi:hypothetical protein
MTIGRTGFMKKMARCKKGRDTFQRDYDRVLDDYYDAGVGTKIRTSYSEAEAAGTWTGGHRRRSTETGFIPNSPFTRVSAIFAL